MGSTSKTEALEPGSKYEWFGGRELHHDHFFACGADTRKEFDNSAESDYSSSTDLSGASAVHRGANGGL